jgi:hypothetical protein
VHSTKKELLDRGPTATTSCDADWEGQQQSVSEVGVVPVQLTVCGLNGNDYE